MLPFSRHERGKGRSSPGVDDVWCGPQSQTWALTRRIAENESGGGESWLNDADVGRNHGEKPTKVMAAPRAAATNNKVIIT